MRSGRCLGQSRCAGVGKAPDTTAPSKVLAIGPGRAGSSVPERNRRNGRRSSSSLRPPRPTRAIRLSFRPSLLTSIMKAKLGSSLAAGLDA